jgi:flavin-dependent dehydrogenase
MNRPANHSNLMQVGSRMSSESVRRVDVVILGGGPAGTSTALALARAGRSVTILERSHYETARVGETLPPEAKQPLTELGVWDRFVEDGHRESPGIAVSWGQPELYNNDFIVNPYGPGWHIDRRRFDSMLAHAARQAGAELMVGAWPIICVRHDEAEWRVDALVDAVPNTWNTATLVDATGRPAFLARRLYGQRTVYDRLVALVGLLPAAVTGTGSDRRTLIESVEEGWWYFAPLPESKHIAVFLTDADLLPARRDERNAFWQRELEQATYVRGRLGPNLTTPTLRTCSACSVQLRPVSGKGWLAVGDAAASFDPLSGQGVIWAVKSGLAAARAADDSLRGDRRSLDRYAQEVEQEYAAYLLDRAEYYVRERRWANSPFWRRRQAATASEFRRMS